MEYSLEKHNTPNHQIGQYQDQNSEQINIESN
jgi:hypothetical protein